jgi:hypothetical protein
MPRNEYGIAFQNQNEKRCVTEATCYCIQVGFITRVVGKNDKNNINCRHEISQIAGGSNFEDADFGMNR